MRSFLNLLKRELHLIVHDHSLLLTLLIAPILYAFFYGSIYTNKEEHEVKIAVVDNDGSHLTRLITEKIDATSIAHVVSAPTINNAKEKLFHGEVQGVLILENGMEKKVLSLKQSNAVLALNTSRFLPSSDLTSVITKTCLTVGAGVRLQYFKNTGKSTKVSLHETNPIHFTYKSLYNEKGNYGTFLLPGLLALILQQTLLIGLAESMSSERQNKQLRSLYTSANESYSSILWGKGLWYFILFASYAFFFMTVNYQLLHLTNRGNIFDLSILFLLFIFTLIPMGLWIGSLFKSQLLSMQVMAFSTYPIFLITGYSLPFESLPTIVQWISSILPTTPFLQAFISITQTGGNLFDNGFHLIHLVILWLVYCLLFIIQYKLNLKKEQNSKKIA